MAWNGTGRELLGERMTDRRGPDHPPTGGSPVGRRVDAGILVRQHDDVAGLAATGRAP